MISSRKPNLSKTAGTDAEDDAQSASLHLARESPDDSSDTINWRRRMEIQVDRLRRFLMNGSDYRGLFTERQNTTKRNLRDDGSHGPPPDH